MERIVVYWIIIATWCQFVIALSTRWLVNSENKTASTGFGNNDNGRFHVGSVDMCMFMRWSFTTGTLLPTVLILWHWWRSSRSSTIVCMLVSVHYPNIISFWSCLRKDVQLCRRGCTAIGSIVPLSWFHIGTVNATTTTGRLKVYGVRHGRILGCNAAHYTTIIIFLLMWGVFVVGLSVYWCYYLM